MIFILLIAFQVKHFLCDFPLQTPYMLGKFKKQGWVEPLAAHAGVHALGTALIVVACGAAQGRIWLPLVLAAFDFVCHFTMDRIKASPDMLGKYKALSAAEYRELPALPADIAKQKQESNTYFWWALGLDQMVHHLTHYAIIYILVM